MAISSSVSSLGLKPGVCTSSTRPVNPYEGMMIFETDTNRVLVYEGAAWVMIADTDTPPGLQLIETKSFASNSLAFDSKFTDEFRNYKILINFTSDNATELRAVFRNSSSDVTTASYRFYQNEMGVSPVTTNVFSGQSYFYVSNAANGGVNSGAAEVTVYAPKETGLTNFRAETHFEWSGDTVYSRYTQGHFNNTTPFDGIRFYGNSANISGTASLYGYRI